MVQVQRIQSRRPAQGSHAPTASFASFVISGRRFNIGPFSLAVILVLIAAVLAWGAASASYILFRDDALAALARHQTNLQSHYETQIEELNTEIHRLTSRKLLNQEIVDRKVEELLKRQTVLESRHAKLAEVSGNLGEGGTRPQRQAEAETPAPVSDVITMIVRPAQIARLESRPETSLASAMPSASEAGEYNHRIASLLRAQNQLEARQRASLDILEDSLSRRVKTMRSIVVDLGLDSTKTFRNSGMGGPFIPVDATPGAGFEQQLTRLQAIQSQIQHFERGLSRVPLRRPLEIDTAMTSNFGVRSDPFLGRPAMHSGVDWRAAPGEPVRATAAGKVIFAGSNGGYGQMVDVDHGDGYVTRYAHLSSIDVLEGMPVQAGMIVGRVGSTGRSTGPHLHYETRINGDAVDPQRFLRAGLKLRQPV